MKTHNYLEILYGENPKNFGTLKFLSSVIGFLWICPLYLLPIIAFSNDYSWFWLINMILLIITYSLIAQISYYVYSGWQMHLFYKEFVGTNRNFTLHKSTELDEIMHSYPNFRILKQKLQFIKSIAQKLSSKGIVRRYADFNADSDAIKIFYASPLNQRILPSCKAYVYIPGLVIVVNRTPNPSKNTFESFLINHELDHISDRGILNLRGLVRAQFFFFVHLIVFGFIAYDIMDIIYLCIFALLVFYSRFILLNISRELIADNHAFLSVKSIEERLNLIRLFKKLFTIQRISARSLMTKTLFKERLEKMDDYETHQTVNYLSETHYNSSRILDDELLRIRTYSRYNDFKTMMGATALLYLAKDWYINPHDFMFILAWVIAVFTLLNLLFGFSSIAFRAWLLKHIERVVQD